MNDIQLSQRSAEISTTTTTSTARDRLFSPDSIFEVSESQTIRNQNPFKLYRTTIDLMCEDVTVKDVVIEFINGGQYYADSNKGSSTGLSTKSQGAVICKPGDTLFHVFCHINKIFMDKIKSLNNSGEHLPLCKEFNYFKDRCLEFIQLWEKSQQEQIVSAYRKHKNSDDQTFSELNDAAMIADISLFSPPSKDIRSELLNVFNKKPRDFATTLQNYVLEIFYFRFLEDLPESSLPSVRQGEFIHNFIINAAEQLKRIKCKKEAERCYQNLGQLIEFVKYLPGFENWIVTSLHVSNERFAQNSIDDLAKCITEVVGDTLCDHKTAKHALTKVEKRELKVEEGSVLPAERVIHVFCRTQNNSTIEEYLVPFQFYPNESIFDIFTRTANDMRNQLLVRTTLFEKGLALSIAMQESEEELQDSKHHDKVSEYLKQAKDFEALANVKLGNTPQTAQQQVMPPAQMARQITPPNIMTREEYHQLLSALDPKVFDCVLRYFLSPKHSQVPDFLTYVFNVKSNRDVILHGKDNSLPPIFIKKDQTVLDCILQNLTNDTEGKLPSIFYGNAKKLVDNLFERPEFKTDSISDRHLRHQNNQLALLNDFFVKLSQQRRTIENSPSVTRGRGDNIGQSQSRSPMQLAASPRNRGNQSRNVRVVKTPLQPLQQLPPGNTSPQDTRNQSRNVQLNFIPWTPNLHTPQESSRRKRKQDNR